jgi:predicted DNA-binding ribbon-helix-helix protein
MSTGQPKPTGKLREGTKRVSYIEETPTYKALDIMAAARDTNLSAVIREATEEYLIKHDRSGDLRRISGTLLAALPDERSERAGEEIDPETQKALARVIGQIRKQ